MKVYFETERLIIRDPVPEDFEVIWAMRNDKHVTAFTGGITGLSRDQLYEKHLKRCNNTEDGPKEYAVILKADQAYIGYCGFQYCQVLGGLEILYGYAKEYWGMGYAYEAAQAVLDFGFSQLKLEAVLAAVNYENIGSDKILMKIGMTYVGDVPWPNQGMVKKYEIKGNQSSGIRGA